MKAVIWISIFNLVFLGLMSGFYMGKDKIFNQTKDVPLLRETRFHINEKARMLTSDSVQVDVDSLQVVIQGLLEQLSGYVMQLQERDGLIDSLSGKIGMLDGEVSALNNQNLTLTKEIESMTIAKNTEQQDRIAGLAKTLGSMKSDILAPILSNLPDNVIRILYDEAKAKDRVKIFNSLAPDRSGSIVRNLAGDMKAPN